MQQIEVQQVFPSPIETVWELYTDHVAWARFMGVGRVTLQPQGSPSRNGVGCVRVFSLGRLDIVAEEVTVFEAPTRMKYRIVRGGGPIRDHEGEVLFSKEAGGTRVIWRCRFTSLIPGFGPLLRFALGGVFRHVFRCLAADLRRG